MGLLEIILIVILVLWLVGGIALPAAGGLLNILLVLVIIYIIYKLAGGNKV